MKTHFRISRPGLWPFLALLCIDVRCEIVAERLLLLLGMVPRRAFRRLKVNFLACRNQVMGPRGPQPACRHLRMGRVMGPGDLHLTWVNPGK